MEYALLKMKLTLYSNFRYLVGKKPPNRKLMNSLFEAAAYQEVKARIDKLTPEASTHWGKMNPAQMLYHCQFPLKLALKTEPQKPRISLLARLIKKSMYSDKHWRKNLPTIKKFKVQEERDFETEKQTLSELIDAFHGRRDQQEWNPHPMFGHFTAEQWGKMQYKHLDHHLRQFGV